MAWQRYGAPSARKFINPQTGEILSRRQYDKRYGALAKAGLESYESKAKIRKAAGIPSRVRVTIAGTDRYSNVERRHIYVRTAHDQIDKALTTMRGLGKNRQANVAVRIKTKEGWRQSRAVSAGASNLSGMLGSSLATLLSSYEMPDDEVPEDFDPEDSDTWGAMDVELDWAYAGA